MIKKFLTIICALILLPACFNNNQNADKHTFLIQAPLNLSVIKEMQEALTPVVNKILQEELGSEQYKDVPIFFFKKRQAITIYYVNDMYDNGKSLLVSAFDTMQGAPVPKNVMLTSQVNFFGEGALIDLVTLIDDPHEELSRLNKEMKAAMHQVNQEYKDVHGVDLYAIAKSERFPYLPHLSLGHLRVNAIKEIVKDVSQAEKVIERIKQRVMKAVSDVLSKLTLDNRKVSFDTLSIYDLKKRTYVKESMLNLIS